MTPFTRWLRFNLVGILGAAVQLLLVSFLVRLPQWLTQLPSFVAQLLPLMTRTGTLAVAVALAVSPAIPPVCSAMPAFDRALGFASALLLILPQRSAGMPIVHGSHLIRAAQVFSRHPLLTATLALELTLLHNFAWHRRYTWRDRCADSPAGSALLRFHVSNGVVSLVGNIAFTGLLMKAGHVPLVTANAAAIVLCSLVNFTLGQRWVFRQAASVSQAGNGRGRASLPG